MIRRLLWGLFKWTVIFGVLSIIGFMMWFSEVWDANHQRIERLGRGERIPFTPEQLAKINKIRPVKTRRL